MIAPERQPFVPTQHLTVLMTGFAPFGGETVNPSWQAVQRVAATWDGPATLTVVELPVVFGESAGVLHRVMRQVQPDLVIAVGQSGGRTQVTPERIAINVDDARIPDNVGNQPIDAPIDPDGPAAWFTTLPVKRAVAAMRDREIPAAVSNSAGTYVCNHVFYHLMSIIAAEFPATRGGFIHVPFSTEQVAASGSPQPGLPVATIADGLTIMLRTALETCDDIAIPGGTEH
ncbi:MAG: pyroglutamyl-peptidase I [Thermomicrobiales bacterium]